MKGTNISANGRGEIFKKNGERDLQITASPLRDRSSEMRLRHRQINKRFTPHSGCSGAALRSLDYMRYTSSPKLS